MKRLLALAGLLAMSVAGAVDLLEVYHQAQAADPTFEAARYALEVIEQRLPQARAGLLPVIAASGNDGSNRADTTFTATPTVQRDIRTWDWAVQLTQPLVRVQNFYAYSEAEANVEQAKAQYAQAEQDLVLRVARAYFDVVIAEDAIVASDAQLVAMTEQLAIARHGFKTGTSSITDVDEAQSRVDLARAQRVVAVNDLEAKRAELEKIVGTTPDRLAVLKPSVVAPRLQPADLASWAEQARDNNPVARAQQAALTAAEATIKKSRAEHLPTLDLTAAVGGNYSSNSTTPADYSTLSRTRTVGVQLNVPLYSGGATSAKVAEAIANRYKLQADLEAAKRQAVSDAKQAYAGIANGLAQIDALASAIVSGQSAVKGNQVGYQLGLRINVDVLNAQQQLYGSQRDLSKARYDTIFQGLKLKAAAGVLSEDDLQVINALLQERSSAVASNSR